MVTAGWPEPGFPAQFEVATNKSEYLVVDAAAQGDCHF